MNLSRRCCGPGTPTPTTLRIRPPSSTPRWLSSLRRSGAGCLSAATPGRVKEFLAHVTALGSEYSVGMHIRGPILDADRALPDQAWRRAVDSDGQLRDGAHVAEVAAWLPASLTGPGGWPPGIRVIVRRERPHPGAQLRITDVNGWRLAAFATNTPRRAGWRLAELEVRHRLRAHAEDRIRCLKDTGIRNLPLQAFVKNQLWLELAQLAYELLVWTQVLGLAGQPARS